MARPRVISAKVISQIQRGAARPMTPAKRAAFVREMADKHGFCQDTIRRYMRQGAAVAA